MKKKMTLGIFSLAVLGLVLCGCGESAAPSVQEIIEQHVEQTERMKEIAGYFGE